MQICVHIPGRPFRALKHKQVSSTRTGPFTFQLKKTTIQITTIIKHLQIHINIEIQHMYLSITIKSQLSINIKRQAVLSHQIQCFQFCPCICIVFNPLVFKAKFGVFNFVPAFILFLIKTTQGWRMKHFTNKQTTLFIKYF